jgi:hypothetical protein
VKTYLAGPYLFIILFFWVLSASGQTKITSFSPEKGNVGSLITINGEGFNASAGSNIVWFGAAKAVVSNATPTSLTVTVPVGASFEPITVLNTQTHLWSYSNKSFLPTYASPNTVITVADFSDSRYFQMAGGPRALAIIDLDGDGRPDIAGTIGAYNTVSILRNTGSAGDIRFAPKIDFPVGNIPYGIAAADIDGDGKPDLVVSNSGADKISVLRNTSTPGNLSFVRRDFVSGDFPNALRIRDFDGDGKPDIAVTNENDAKVGTFRNLSVPGDVQLDYKPGGYISGGPGVMVAGDMDGDGVPDVATSTLSGYATVLRNVSTTGNPLFATGLQFTAEWSNHAVTDADFDGDGKTDLALASDSKVNVLRNTSVAGNLSFAAKVTIPGGLAGYAITAGDLNGDGKPDIITGNWTAPQTDRISILQNNSTPGVLSFGAKVPLAADTGPFAIAVYDMDLDGKPDIITADNGNSGVTVFRNNPQPPVLSPATNVTFSATSGTGSQVNWTSGTGEARAVFIKAVSSGTPSPVNNTTYNANNTFGSGTQIDASGWFCVYNGAGNTVAVTGLTPGTVYQVMVVEYNGAKGGEQYLATPTTGNPAAFMTVSADATLSNLTTSVGFLTPAFSPGVIVYTLNVAYGVDRIYLKPVVNVSAATVKVNGNTVISGNPSLDLNLNVGANTFPVVVTAPDGLTQKTYTVTVIRAPLNDANLAGIVPNYGTLSPGFAPSITSYDLSVVYNIAALKLYLTTIDPAATITINGAQVTTNAVSPDLPLVAGTNTLAIKVRSAGGAEKSYIITIHRGYSPDADLLSLVPGMGALSPAFNPAMLAYQLNVPYTTTSMTFKATTNDAGAVIKLNGQVIASGNTSGALPLTQGANNFTFLVTAQDGTHAKTYMVTVNRAAPPDANLLSLTASTGALSPVFNGIQTTSYTLTVAPGTPALTLTPTVAAAGATLTVNGLSVLSGTTTGNISLFTGHTAVTIVVTATDGNTKKTYLIDVVRPKSDPVLTFDAFSPKTLCEADFYAGAHSSNPLSPISYSSSDLNVATVAADGKIHLIAAGTVVITAIQAANADFNPATGSQTLIVTASPQPTVVITSSATRSGLSGYSGKLYGGAHRGYRTSAFSMAGE